MQVVSWSPKDGSFYKRLPKSSAIKVIDFGSTAYEHQNHNYIVSTRHYRAPVVILGMPLCPIFCVCSTWYFYTICCLTTYLCISRAWMELSMWFMECWLYLGGTMLGIYLILITIVTCMLDGEIFSKNVCVCRVKHCFRRTRISSTWRWWRGSWAHYRRTCWKG